MNELTNVEQLQKRTRLVMALKTEGGLALADDLATRLQAWIERLILSNGTDAELMTQLYECRGVAKLLGEQGYEVRAVIDMAARSIVKQQMHLTKPPTTRRDYAQGSEGEAEDGQ